MDLLLASLTIVGTGFLCASLAPVREILRELRAGSLRRQWCALNALVVSFIVGYAVFGAMMSGKSAAPLDLVVGAILAAGGAFVLIVTSLFRRTVVDLTRIADLERDVLLDPLTNVFNRRYLESQLRRDVEHSLRCRESLSTLLIDIDHFKRINDSYGHIVGDAVLRRFSSVLSSVSQTRDTVARYGGEEFVIVAPGHTEAAAAELGERLRATIESTPMGLDGGNSIPVTVSIGISTIRSCDQASDLLRRADEALYAAKRGGRNRVFAFSLEPAVAAA